MTAGVFFTVQGLRQANGENTNTTKLYIVKKKKAVTEEHPAICGY